MKNNKPSSPKKKFLRAAAEVFTRVAVSCGGFYLASVLLTDPFSLGETALVGQFASAAPPLIALYGATIALRGVINQPELNFEHLGGKARQSLQNLRVFFCKITCAH